MNKLNVVAVLVVAAIIAGQIYSWADFTVSKAMTETFQMYNADGTARTNCVGSRFSVKTYKDGLPVSLTWTFRNFTSGDYSMKATPTSAGYYVANVNYSGIQVGTFTDVVRNYDTDTLYADMAKDSTVLKSAHFDEYTGTPPPIILTPIDGAAEYAGPKVSASPVSMYAGDTANIQYRILNADKTAFNLTGYTVKMGAKKNATDTAFVIGTGTPLGPRTITSDVDSPATLGTGWIRLTNADTKNLPAGKYVVDVKVYKDTQQVTTSRLYLTIQTPVIK